MTGNMTMTSNSGGVTNLFLFPTELSRSYQQIYLLFDPAGVDTIEYRFYRKPSVLSADNDIPDIPHPFSQILAWEATLLIAAYNNMNDTGRIKAWTAERDRWMDAMVETFAEGNSVGAEPRFIRANFSDNLEVRPRYVT